MSINRRQAAQQRHTFTTITPIEQTLGDFIKNCPYRDHNKIKALVKQKYNVDINDDLIDKYVPKLNNFNEVKSKKKYQLKTVAKPNSYMGDIFFPVGRKVAFLLLIEINTRKAFAYQLGDIQEHEIINVDGGYTDSNGIVRDEAHYERTILAPTTGLKTTVSLIKAFNKFLIESTHPVKYLRFDGETGINNDKFQSYLKENGIEFIPVLKDAHTSLSLINRLCRTLRDIAFNMNVDIIDQNIMNQVLDNYNNAPHKGLTEACFNYDSRLKKLYPNGISPNDVYYSGTFGICPKGVRYLERVYIIECLRYNYIIAFESDDLYIRDKCRIYEESGKFDKKRSKLSKDIYQIVGCEGNIYQVQNIKTGKIKNVQRAYISKI